jgi:hypothetical protein
VWRWYVPSALLALTVATSYELHAGDGAVTGAPPSGAPHPAAPPSAAAHRVTPELVNRIAYVPPQCFTKTRDPGDEKAKNPCYVCHTRSEPPNYTNDDNLQLELKLPKPAAHNPWTNLFDPPVSHVARLRDDEILRYVRQSNYFDERGHIALAETLGQREWRGFVPDVWFSFDAEGFDHAPDGQPTGWRAFAYYPFPGTFFPTNGSADDVLIRLAPSLRQDEGGRFDRSVYVVNFAIVEALLRRADIPIDPVDERRLGVDLDLDGKLSVATRVAFDAARMHYVGRAHAEQAEGKLLLAAGLFPADTEFFHTVRYLDVGPDGTVTMAPRMKEVRYARKANFISWKQAKTMAAGDEREAAESPDGTHRISWQGDNYGVYVKAGWLLQGYIEAEDGALRLQSFEETVFCEGCHGEIGATTDATFAFARKLSGNAPARGWFHWSQHGLHDVAEPKRADGDYEYTRYLAEAGAGDELRENDEVIGRFFDDAHQLRPEAVARLHSDVAYLLLPSPERALDLDRAYRAIVEAQSFDKGRDSVLAPSRNVLVTVPLGERTGVATAVTALALRFGP